MDIDLTSVTWRNARRSTANGGNCIEVGLWRKSSHSGDNGGECVEVGVWRKSSHSTDNGTTASRWASAVPRHRTA